MLIRYWLGTDLSDHEVLMLWEDKPTNNKEAIQLPTSQIL